MLNAAKSTINNYTGNWTTNASWTGGVASVTTGIAEDITINGFISYTGDISFGGGGGDLIINDTLVINGNLTLGNNNNITVNNNSVLVVRGNVTIANKVDIAANAYIVITGNFEKTGSSGQGSFTSDDTPSKVFIGGTITVPGTWGTGSGGVLDCNQSPEYTSSTCNYGNSTDILSDPILPFIQSTCISSPTAPTTTGASRCGTGTVTLTAAGAGAGESYKWYSAATGGTLLQTGGTTYTTPSISATTTYYVSKYNTTSLCESTRTSVVATVTATNTAGVGSSTPTLCINTVLTNITHATTGATGIGAATGLPAGVTAAWSANTITISGTPTASGVFNYSIPLTGGCGTVNATGTITVTALPVATFSYNATPYCSNEANPLPTLTGSAGVFSSTAGLNFVSTATGQINLATTTEGTYTVTNTIAASGGCPQVTANTSVNIYQTPNTSNIQHN